MSCKPTVLVTGSAGHLGRALMLALPDLGYAPLGIDIKPSETTTLVGSVTDAAFLAHVFSAHPIAHVIHAATLHKPHVVSHTKNDFVQTNIAGTLALLECATTSEAPTAVKLKSFVYISTTSAFGSALSPAPGQPAAWIDESVSVVPAPAPKNIYGATKTAAEDLCWLAHREHGVPVVVLRTSRFFPEEDDDEARRAAVAGEENLKVLELAYRRVDVADVVGACVCAMEKAGRGEVTWGRYIISAPTPFRRDGEVLKGLDEDAGRVFRQAVPGCGEVFERKGWRFLERVDRVYDASRAVRELGWKPEYTFEKAVERIAKGEEWRSPLTIKVGKLGYHDVPTGVYTTQ
ncbi:hypothetical protein VTK56DRAFT_9377 [Thermocarpiscus australiensis]